jgi:catechol 2,3-dioxygenase-like lactoylglutathione lyase family enzyme
VYTVSNRVPRSSWLRERYTDSVMQASIEKVSAITFIVADMQRSVRFYQDVLRLELFYGGTDSGFSSLRIPDTESPIINLQRGNPAIAWGRMIFHVSDVDLFWSSLREKGFNPDSPRDATWGERYFHIHDPDGHELSFARPI